MNSPHVPLRRPKLRLGAGTYKPKTSMMIRHIPCTMKNHHVESALSEAGLQGTYSCVFMPMNGRMTSNKGYCFVNFDSWDAAQHCWWLFHGQPFGKSCRSTKICEVTWASEQR